MKRAGVREYAADEWSVSLYRLRTIILGGCFATKPPGPHKIASFSLQIYFKQSLNEDKIPAYAGMTKLVVFQFSLLN